MPNDTITILIVDEETSTTSEPSASTDGIPCLPLQGRKRSRVHLLLEKAAASGSRTAKVKLFGYVKGKQTIEEHGDTLGNRGAVTRTDVASSDEWYEIFNTGDLSEAADFNQAFLINDCTDYDRLYAQVVTNGGSTPTLSVSLRFGVADYGGGA